jgi:AraC family transcriptional regulator
MIATPQLYLSSAAAGWDGLVAQAFHEPPALEGWQATPDPDVTLVLFRGGAMHIEQRRAEGRSPWRGQTMHQGDMLLTQGGGESYEVRWHSLSADPMQTLHMRVRADVFTDIAAEIAGCEPQRLEFGARARLQDPLLTQIGFAVWRELEEPSPVGKLYAQTAAQLLAVHLLRHYSATGPRTIIPAGRIASQTLTPRQMQRVIAYIQANLEQDLSLDALAQEVGFSPYYFARLFRRTTGESPHQLVVRLRSEHARRLLVETALPLAHIAQASGFANQSHLTRIFKQHYGLTPRAFRHAR